MLIVDKRQRCCYHVKISEIKNCHFWQAAFLVLFMELCQKSGDVYGVFPVRKLPEYVAFFRRYVVFAEKFLKVNFSRHRYDWEKNCGHNPIKESNQISLVNSKDLIQIFFLFFSIILFYWISQKAIFGDIIHIGCSQKSHVCSHMAYSHITLVIIWEPVFQS